jgi:hypothetical protein
MATATTHSLGKTGFVKEFLNDNPQANTKSVNDAWAAEGFEGTISSTLVTKIRSEMGLTGNIPKGPGKEAEPETGTQTTATGKRRGKPEAASMRGGNQGKSAFVTEHLQQNPHATDDEINEAWASAGNEGGISGSLIYKIRTKERLTRKRGIKGRGAGKMGRAKSSLEGTGADQTPEPVAGTPKPLARRANRGRIIEEFEGDIDRLIFKLMAVGGMETIEDELRKVRRRLILSQGV